MWAQLFLILALFSSMGWAYPDCPDPERPFGNLAEIAMVISQIDAPDCRRRERDPPEGFICRTSRGVKFQRVLSPEPGWFDLGANGKLWFDEVKNEVDQPGAIFTCEQGPGQILPSKEDFRNAERHGFQEVLNDMFQFFYWSRSGVHGQESAYGFSSGANVLAAMNKNSAVGYIAARCVKK